MKRLTRTCLLPLLAVLPLLFAAAPAPAHSADIVEFLPPAVEQLIKKHRINKNHIGLMVQRSNGTLLAAHQAQRPFNPASAIKIVTALAAVDLLDISHRWKTTIAKTGSIKDGTLEGNLYLIGGGDPYLTTDQFLYLLNQLRNSGIHHIAGDVVIDDSIFRLPPHDPAEFDGVATRVYNVGGGGLVVNFKAQEVIFQPGENGIQVYTDPPNLNFQIDNRVKIGKTKCRSWRGKIREQLLGTAQQITLRVSGSYARRCGRQSFYISALEHPAYVAGVFGALWQRLGGSWSGNWKNAPAPDKVDTLIEHESNTLLRALVGMNKFSNNVIARNLYLSLPAGGDQPPPYTPETAQQTLQQWLHENGVPDIVMENGSGLSRKVRITPAEMTHLLTTIWQHPYRAELISSLPIIGRDGTLRKRMRKTALAGEGHLKTGSLKGVTALSGFFRDKNGDTLLLTLFSEKQSTGRIHHLQQDIMQWAYSAAQ